MDIYFEKGGAVIDNLEDFDISAVLECGQCFRFERLEEQKYRIKAGGKVFTACQKGERLSLLPMDEKEFTGYFRHYFDLDRDYGALKAELSANDNVLKEAVSYAPGIRILNQDFWEMIISFIISQNNRIPMIKKVIENLCVSYGKETVGGFDFPKASDLADVSIDEYMGHKTGFRAKYIKDAVERKLKGELEYNLLSELSTEDLRKELLKVYGIGNKVADCIMLFGMGRGGVFPADVWIKRVISELYFGGKEMPLKEIQAFAKHKWGDNAGFAQQYLFHYARVNKIGAGK